MLEMYATSAWKQAPCECARHK